MYIIYYVSYFKVLHKEIDYLTKEINIKEVGLLYGNILMKGKVSVMYWRGESVKGVKVC